jgi:hypothetical protein
MSKIRAEFHDYSPVISSIKEAEVQKSWYETGPRKKHKILTKE